MKKNDPTYMAHIQDERGRGEYGFTMVVVKKSGKIDIFMLKDRKIFFSGRHEVFLIKNEFK